MKKAVSIFLASVISTYNLTYVNAQQTESKPSESQHSVTKEGSQQIENHLSHEGHHSSALVSATDSLKALLADMKQYRATFNQTVVDAQQNVVHEAQGVLTMTRPNKLRWETTFPDETLLIADGEAVWNVDTFVEQVTVLSQESAIKDNPIVLLTASDNATWSQFSITELNVSVEDEALR
ncbi:MAG: outer membrane lipoprotein chaperone LolA, partial [Pseudomonadota bacterium]|nr:outer membrane lipoprotein chaperone LolA [Pseudomonadota bacterium]